MAVPALLLTCLLPFASAACSRIELAAADAAFGSAITTHHEFPTAPDVKVSENMKMLAGLNDTSIHKYTGRIKPNFRMQAIDEQACSIMSMLLINEGPETPSPTPENPGGVTILSYRLTLAGEGKPVSEIEILATNKDEKPGFFEPFSYPDEIPELWHSPAPMNHTRQQVLDVAESYVQGIEEACPECVKSTPECRRIENGYTIPPACNEQFEFMGFPVYARRWVVDPMAGLVVGLYFFGPSGSPGLFTHEWFAVRDGLIQEISANFLVSEEGMVDVWTGQGPPEDWVRPANAKDRPAGSSPPGSTAAVEAPAEAALAAERRWIA